MSLEFSHTIGGHKAVADLDANLSLNDLRMEAPVRMPSLAALAQPDLFAGHAAQPQLVGDAVELAAGGVVTNTAPAPTIADGQLWWGADVAGSDADLGYFNDNGSTFTREHLDSDTHGLVYDVGLDTAAGWAFTVNSDNTLTEYNIATGAYNGSALSFGVHTGNANLDDVVSALAVDPIRHIIYVGDWGSDNNSTGVRAVSYNAATGAMTDTGFVFTAASTEGGGGDAATKYTNARDFSLSVSTQTLYYADNDSGYMQNPYHPTNAIYAVNVGSGGHTPIQLTNSTQFPAGSGSVSAGGTPTTNSPNGFISALALDEADHRVYFLVSSFFETTNATQNQLYWVDTTTPNQTAHLVTGVTVGYPWQNSGLTYDSELRQLYISDNSASHTQIIQAQLSVDGNSVTSSTTYSLTTLEAGNAPAANSHVFGTALNLLPILNLTATTAHVGEQGANVDLSSALTDSDADGGYLKGATIKISSAGWTSNESSTADDHLAYGSSTSSSGSVAGTSISWSFNSATETLTLSGYDTLSNYQTALGGISFFSTGDNPTNYAGNTTRTISWSIDDGTPNAPTNGQNTGSQIITIDAVNDAASVAATTAGSDAATKLEANGVTATGSLTITDPDNLTDNMSIVSVTESGATSGIANATLLSYLSLNSATATHAANVSSSTDGWSFSSGAQGFDYLAPNQTLTLTYVVRANDGTANTDHNVTINIQGVNDAPAGADATLTALEDTARVFTAADFGFTDVDGGALQAVKFTTVPGAGQVLLNGAAVTAGQSVTATEIAAGHLTYLAAANANGTGYASLTFQVQDNQGTLNGGVDLDQTANTLTFNVTAVNDAPSGADVAKTILEDATYTFATADFGFSDPNDSPANTLLAVKISTLPASGSLALNGTAVTAGQFVSASEIAAGHLVFTPAANANGAGYGNFTFQVQDNGGTSNGGVDTDPTANTFTLNVTSVNDAPSGASNTVTTLEDNSHVFSVGEFGFSDTADGNSLQAVKIGTISGGGSLLLNGVAVTAGQSVAASEITAGHLVFTPAANANGAGYGSFTFQVQDNGGTANGGVDTDPTGRTMTVNVTSVNDAPTAADKTITTLEDTGYTFSASDFGFNDTDGNSLLALKINALPSGGSLTLNGSAVTAGQSIAATDIGGLVFTPAHNANGSPESSFTFQVQDNGGTANGGVDLSSAKTITVNVTPVNDAPTAADKTITTAEDTAYTFSASDFGFSDTEGNSMLGVTITSLPADGALTLGGAAVTANEFIATGDLGTLVFTPANNGNGAPYAGFTFTVKDNGGVANGGVDTSAGHTISFDVTSVNDAPAAADKTITTLEDHAYTFAASDFGFSDSDGNALLGVTIATLPADGSLTLNGTAVTANQFITAGNLDKLVFTPASNVNGAAEASFTFTVKDDGGTANGGVDTSAAHTISFDVTSVNDAPTAADKTITTDEDTAYTFAASDFGFSDSDGNALLGVTIATLPADGSLTLNGTAVSANQFITAANLDKLVFTPATNANGAPEASFTFTVSDDGGTANGGVDTSAAHTISFDVTSINDAPTAADKTITTLEDHAYTFAASDFGFSDSDGNSFLGVTIATVPADGSLTLNGTAVSANDFVAAADLDKLVFTPAANANGAPEASFTFTVKDDGGTANGGSDTSATHTISLDVTSVNDAPTAADKTITTDEDTAYTFAASDFGFSDSDGNSLLGVTVATLPADGSLTLNGTAVSANQFITAANLDKLVFTPATNANGPAEASFTFTVTDDGGTTNGGVDTSGTHTISFDVNSVNDAPTAADKTITTLEDHAYTFAASDFGFSDSDGNSLLAVKITSLPGSGTLTLNGSAVAAGDLVQAADVGNLVWYPPGDGNGSGLASFKFQVQDDGGTANGGDDLSTAKTITFDVTAVNDAPVVNAGISDRSVYFNYGFTFFVGGAAFADVDGDALTYSAVLNLGGGVTQALPSWLNFDSTTGKFSGTPPQSDVGVLDVQVTASDGHGGSVATDFNLTIVGNQTLNGTPADETLRGHDGDDVINGNGGHDTLIGSGGNDTITGGGSSDNITGGSGDDVLRGGGGGDNLNGGSGNDVALYYDSATGVHIDLLDQSNNSGGAAGDTLTFIERIGGSSHDDVLIGGNTRNWFKGANGDDQLTGSGSSDTLRGGDGADTLHGGGGHDLLIGGAGADTFDFSTLADSGKMNSDLITDFSTAEGDQLDISQLLDSNPATHIDFIGTARFDGLGPEVRYVVKNGETYVSADLDGDKHADFQVRLAGSLTLHAGDFVL